MDNKKISFNSSENRIANRFYKDILKYLNPNADLLNIGCGKYLVFENYILSNLDVNISCCDVLPVEINYDKKKINFFIQDIEKPFKLKKKYDIITFFEVIEHIDNTDILLQNCYNNLKKNGLLIFSCPNLASIYCRIELLLGFQPHILEVSNVKGNFGQGIFGKMQNPEGHVIHHIRGITYKAMIEMIKYNRFVLQKVIATSINKMKIFVIPSLAPNNIYICKKL